MFTSGASGNAVVATLKSVRTLGRFIFWDFPRASWQYDVMVALILAFILLTPREIFRDQPKAASIVLLPANQGYLLEPKLLDDVPEAEWISRATALVQQRYKNHATVLRVEPVEGESEDEITGYLAYTKP